MRKILMSVAALAMSLSLAGMARADMNVAVVGPMTGGYASFGEQMKAGAELAVEDINEAGGVLGEKLVLTVGDDACDPKQAVSVANKLAANGIIFAAGHYCSGSSIPASSVYAEEGIIQISPASTNPKFTDERPGPNIFRVCGRDDQQGAVAGKYLADNFKDKNVAIVHDKQAYSKGLADETQKAMNAAGKKEVMYETVTPGEKDYNALVSKLKQAQVDVLYYAGYHPEAGLIVRQMRDQGMDTLMISGDALVTEDFWKITGDAAEGTLMTFSPDPRKNPVAAELVKRFREKGIEPEGYVLYTYAAFQAWKQAVEDAGSTDMKKVVDALNAGKFNTVIGTFEFDENGDPNLPPYAFYRWHDGTYAQID